MEERSAVELIEQLDAAAKVAALTDGMSLRVIAGGVQFVYIWGGGVTGFQHLDNFTPWGSILNSKDNILVRAVTGLKKKASNFGTPA